MKTIGTCENCQHWRLSANLMMECQHPKNQENSEGNDIAGITARNCEFAWLEPGSKFGCIHWQAKESFKDFEGSLEEFMAKERASLNLPNYPTRTREELRIEDLEAENDAALEKIVALSNALCNLGYDPTQLPAKRRFPTYAEQQAIPLPQEIAEFRTKMADLEKPIIAEMVRRLHECTCGNPPQHVTGWDSDLCYYCRKRLLRK